MIQILNVTKVYPNGVKALSDISLRVNKGEFVFLVGPSGAGKSTLTKLLYREELPTRGQVLFNGRNLIRMKPREVPHLRRKIGLIFQDFRLLPRKTVFENVAFALEVTGASKREIKKSVPAVLNMVGLGHKLDVFPDHLSGGEQQRVCIARAIVNNPLLIIADEPTGNLDPETSWGLMKLLIDINRRGTTIIMSTHAYDIVDTMKKRVVALSGGQIVRDEEEGAYGYEA
ncbi:MAG: cell division ATP-binding protein FtsE [Firmicutes bacterium]|nr:cell division ATP-binding protein FtsE [Bacillota bacterium]